MSTGEFADLRPTPKVYLDSNIVSAIAKDDTPTTEWTITTPQQFSMD
jgi:hypothetical protein